MHHLCPAALAIVLLLAACAPAGAAGTPAAPASADCPVALPNGNAPPNERPGSNYYGNAKLWTLLPPDGTFLVTYAD
jgi:hypothetical protein